MLVRRPAMTDDQTVVLEDEPGTTRCRPGLGAAAITDEEHPA